MTVDGILIDVTARRQAALAFAETSSRLAHIIESIDEYIYTDVAGVEGHLGRPLYASPGIFRTLGRSVPLERLNEEWEAAVHPDDLAVFQDSNERMANGESIEVEYRIVRPDGDVRWIFDRARPRRTPDGRMLIDGVIADITERRRVADELAAARDEADRRSRVDALTGVFNRGHFTEALAAELDRAARADAAVGLLIADIDHFKRVNDTYGHLVGDRVLAEIAESSRDSRCAATTRSHASAARSSSCSCRTCATSTRWSASASSCAAPCAAGRSPPAGMRARDHRLGRSRARARRRQRRRADRRGGPGACTPPRTPGATACAPRRSLPPSAGSLPAWIP